MREWIIRFEWVDDRTVVSHLILKANTKEGARLAAALLWGSTHHVTGIEEKTWK